MCVLKTRVWRFKQRYLLTSLNIKTFSQMPNLCCPHRPARTDPLNRIKPGLVYKPCIPQSPGCSTCQGQG